MPEIRIRKETLDRLLAEVPSGNLSWDGLITTLLESHRRAKAEGAFAIDPVILDRLRESVQGDTHGDRVSLLLDMHQTLRHALGRVPAPEKSDEPPKTLTCHFCRTTSPDTPRNREVWTPGFWVDDMNEVERPVCPRCTTERLEWDADNKVFDLKPD